MHAWHEWSQFYTLTVTPSQTPPPHTPHTYRDQINTNPSTYASYLANSHYLSSSFPPPNFSAIKQPQSDAAPFKSLLLKSSGRGGLAGGGGVEPMSGPMFTKCQVPNKMWFVVHPDWRMEPRPGEDIM